MLSFAEAITELRDFRLRNSKTLSALLMELNISAAAFEPWPADFFDEILSLLADEEFRSVKDSWELLYFINGAWDELTAQQCERLRVPLEKAFPQWGDWMGAFVTAEIIGERYGDHEALMALLRLGKTARCPARYLVPHGLEVFAKVSKDEKLRQSAVAHLKELAESGERDMRREAEESLSKLVRER